MKHRKTLLQAIVPIALAMTSIPALAKDEVVSLEQCPPAVQAVIRHYSAKATLEEIGYDEKKKSGGPAIYEVKFNTSAGKRIEVHITTEGKVTGFEEKKPKS